MNWNAIGAIATALTLLATVYFFWRGGTRSIVTVSTIHVEGEIDGNHVVASRIWITNRGTHIADFVVRIETLDRLNSCKISEANSIDTKSAKILREDRDVIVSITDLPAGEKVALDIFSLLAVRSYAVKGGSSRFVIKSLTDFYFRRIFIACFGIFSLSVTVAVMDVLNG